MYGPIVFKQKRSKVKFILVLKKLVARRGNVISIYSDNVSNFIGAERKREKPYYEMDNSNI